MNRGPEDHGSLPGGPAGHGYGLPGDGTESVPSTPGSALVPASGAGAPRPTRAVRLVSGDLLVTVNPVDGSEVEPCPPDRRPPRPVKRTATERAELARAARPPMPQVPVPPRPPLLERDEERARLGRLISRGRSVRLTGPAGSGRSTLLDAVAEDFAGLAPDGVVRLSGHRRTVKDVLHGLFTAVYQSDLHRPDETLQGELIREIGAVVVVDDLEFGGPALDELLDATPECAFVLATTPDVAAPSAHSHLEEVFLGGLGRDGGMTLLRHTVDRDLTQAEAEWAADLWFESGGLPARFVQAGALLRCRDQLRAGAGADGSAGPVPEVPLPSLAEGSAPVALLASLLSESARGTLRFGVALGGEVPHRAQLPALLADPRADAALAELLAGGLITPVGNRYRLAAGVQAQLEAVGYADDTGERTRIAGEHYAWWAGHPSVGPERVRAEADAVLATIAALIPRTSPQHTAGGQRSLAVRLARTAAPAFAAGLDWGVWERALRSGQEAARRSGEVAEEAYFHHELGVLALCHGRLDRARAELEASIGLRGALADKRGTIAGRRALALVGDRSGPLALPPGPSGSGPADGAPETSGAVPVTPGTTPPAGVQTSFGSAAMQQRLPVPATAPDGPETAELPPTASGAALTARLPAAGRPDRDDDIADVSSRPGRHAAGAGGPATLVGSRSESSGSRSATQHRAVKNTRRNVVAASAGAVLAAVLGTVVTLGVTSDKHDDPATKVGPDPAMSQDDGSGIAADEPPVASSSAPDPTGSGTSGTPSAPGSPTPSGSGSPSAPPGGAGAPHRTPPPPPHTSHKPSSKPPAHSHRPPSSKPPTSEPPSQSPSAPPSSPSPDDPPPPGASDSASGPAPSTSTGDPTGTDTPPSSASASSTVV